MYNFNNNKYIPVMYVLIIIENVYSIQTGSIYLYKYIPVLIRTVGPWVKAIVKPYNCIYNNCSFY